MVEGENDGEHEESKNIEEMGREFETDLSCRMVTASRSQEGLMHSGLLLVIQGN